MLGPTIEEMRAFLCATTPYADEFDREQAIYWFASLYHSGQGSNLYKALSASQFKPGAAASAPELGEDDCFDVLVLKYAADTLDNPGG